MRQVIAWGLIGCALALVGCGSSRTGYLEEHVGQATQRQVEDELGRPDLVAMKDLGQTVWLYEDCWPPGACSIWALTFDRDRILQSWDRAPEHF